MTPRNQAGAPAAAAQRPVAANAAAPAQRGGFLRRWGGPIVGGLLAAGLIGMLMGHGFGGAAGMLALLAQVGVVALLAFLAMRLFRRPQPAQEGRGYGARAEFERPAEPRAFEGLRAPAASAPVAPAGRDGDELGVGQEDFEAFERLLTEVQSAFGREDYAALRERTTPEIMSYLAEELSQNAVAGRRNDVREVRLLQGDLSEAWSEDGKDYATVAMRYSDIDQMRARDDDRLLEGDDSPTETTEVWTFVRDRTSPWGGGWKLSAIQDVEPSR
jgi:predicted lipid-binding transport protein (Tim44 family)